MEYGIIGIKKRACKFKFGQDGFTSRNIFYVEKNGEGGWAVVDGAFRFDDSCGAFVLSRPNNIFIKECTSLKLERAWEVAENVEREGLNNFHKRRADELKNEGLNLN